jgi:hypothetical protein
VHRARYVALRSAFNAAQDEGRWVATAKEAHRVRFGLDRGLGSIGLLGPTASGLALGLGIWGTNKIGPPLGLGLWGPKQIGPFLGLGLSGPKQIRPSLGLGLSLGPAPGRALVWTRAPGWSGLELGVERAGSATSQPALGLEKSNLPHRTKKQRG